MGGAHVYKNIQEDCKTGISLENIHSVIEYYAMKSFDFDGSGGVCSTT